MKKHSDYVTHINNKEDEIYLRKEHFPVNMRLFNTSLEYKNIILSQCEYIKDHCLQTKEGYKKPHGMSSANLGLSFNIIGITKNRNTKQEYCQIMINPIITNLGGNEIEAISNCGSLTLKDPIKLYRHELVQVLYFDIDGNKNENWFNRKDGSFTIQHEIDHNLGILITDYIK
jgi:peptide deformylase